MGLRRTRGSPTSGRPARSPEAIAWFPLLKRDSWLRCPVVVEEKLDGANVSIWWEDQHLKVAARGGPGAMDRAGQLGPLRARVDRLYPAMRWLLADGAALYAEWLWLTHTIVYDQLPDHLIVLDIRLPGRGFAPLPERDELCRSMRLPVPPRLFSGVLGTAENLRLLLGRSRFGATAMEGIVLCRDDGRVAKVVRAGFVPAPDDRIARRRNTLAGRVADDTGAVGADTNDIGDTFP